MGQRPDKDRRASLPPSEFVCSAPTNRRCQELCHRRCKPPPRDRRASLPPSEFVCSAPPPTGTVLELCQRACTADRTWPDLSYSRPEAKHDLDGAQTGTGTMARVKRTARRSDAAAGRQPDSKTGLSRGAAAGTTGEQKRGGSCVHIIIGSKSCFGFFGFGDRHRSCDTHTSFAGQQVDVGHADRELGTCVVGRVVQSAPVIPQLVGKPGGATGGYGK